LGRPEGFKSCHHTANEGKAKQENECALLLREPSHTHGGGSLCHKGQERRAVQVAHDRP
jgi:hypothetical protein